MVPSYTSQVYHIIFPISQFWLFNSQILQKENKASSHARLTCLSFHCVPLLLQIFMFLWHLYLPFDALFMHFGNRKFLLVMVGNPQRYSYIIYFNAIIMRRCQKRKGNNLSEFFLTLTSASSARKNCHHTTLYHLSYLLSILASDRKWQVLQRKRTEDQHDNNVPLWPVSDSQIN